MTEFERFTAGLKWGCGLIACGLSFLLGESDTLLSILIALLVLDYLTGVISAYVSGKQLSSRVGMEGIAKKVMYLALVVLANLMDKVLNTPGSLRALVLGFLIANESLSVLENCRKCGIPIPLKLKEALEKFKSPS